MGLVSAIEVHVVGCMAEEIDTVDSIEVTEDSDVFCVECAHMNSSCGLEYYSVVPSWQPIDF